MFNEEVLSQLAWNARENASTTGGDGTKVGCALLSTTDEYSTGCNVEHRFKTLTVHAEINAISTMITRGGPGARVLVILIAADRDKFTPCGVCRDMIAQFAAPGCEVLVQSSVDSVPLRFKVEELIPHYPR